MFKNYDLIVVGAGHAGCEAAAAAATMGSAVLLITMDLTKIASMSCNPAMGGVAKGQIIREIDALGGMSGIVSDKSMIQFRMLNKSKGAAMWSPRSQNDRTLFSIKWREILEKNKNVDFWQDSVSQIIIKDKICLGVSTKLGGEIYSKSVILTNGTFLNGIIHLGNKQFGGGRISENSSSGITEQLVSVGFESGRMKTGTPPRIDGRTINYTRMEEQKGDVPHGTFSFNNAPQILKQMSCWITHTNLNVHEELKKGFLQSPIFNGTIDGVGPRYCPSIEDKINRFSERDRHQIFVEPEGWNTIEVYVNGFSTSLPEGVQYSALKKISGFENVKMLRPGYAIEYDFFQPTQLKPTLETKNIKNLYFAGQINGTTGYEEAACQGLVAGINSYLKINTQAAFVLNRSDAYIGVLIDDLINKGTEEPYRMFTSRAEFRILLRQDNADLRLTKMGNIIGLATKKALNKASKKKMNSEKLEKYLISQSVTPAEINPALNILTSSTINESTKFEKLLKRPEISISKLSNYSEKLNNELIKYKEDEITECEIQIKYGGYIEKEKILVEKMKKLEDVCLPKNFDYSQMKSISSEAREKLNRVSPETLGQASRISGVSPADISAIMIMMGR